VALLRKEIKRRREREIKENALEKARLGGSLARERFLAKVTWFLNKRSLFRMQLTPSSFPSSSLPEEAPQDSSDRALPGALDARRIALMVKGKGGNDKSQVAVDTVLEIGA